MQAIKITFKYISILFILLSLYACSEGGDGGLDSLFLDDESSTLKYDLGNEAFYSFDETQGATSFNSSKNIFHGEIVAANHSIGKVNDSLYFGADLPSYVMFKLNYHDPDINRFSQVIVDFPTNEISVEAWIKFESLDLQQVYHFFGNQIGGTRSFKMDVIDGQFRFILFTDSNAPIELVRTNYSFGVDVWHHVAFTFNGSTSKFYIDGALNNENNIIGNIKQVYNTLYLGGSSNDGGSFPSYDDGTTSFTGYIDELRFSATLRTPQEIEACYQSTQ